MYNITKDESIIIQDIFTKDEINSFSFSNTGSILFNESGNYTICGIILNTSINDSNTNNDHACKSVIVINTKNISCDISLNISSKDLFNDSIEYSFNIKNNTFHYIISYYIN